MKNRHGNRRGPRHEQQPGKPARRGERPGGRDPKESGRLLSGTLRVSMKGVGYLEVPGRDEDVEIQKERLGTGLNGDTVEARVLGKGGRNNRLQGEIVRIVSRIKKMFVGSVRNEGGRSCVIPDDKRFYTEIALSGAQPLENDTKVQVEITRWDNPAEKPEGRLVKKIGKKGDHDVEMLSIVLEKGFHSSFPPDAEREAEAIERNFRDGAGAPLAAPGGERRDFRSAPVFTIDPADAKDFDDAISVRRLADGLLEIGVHIADVSHYVREGAALDREARSRGFSVYLVDRTIPMLPHALSNDVCSLNPDEDRLAFSAVFTMDLSGAVKSRWFGRTLIHSRKRFTYEEAQEILRRGDGTFAEELGTLNAVAKKLRAEKMRQGAIDFEQEEVRFELDAAGRPIRIFKKERLDTHKLVEEFMLLANKEVAEFIFKARAKRNSQEPFIYRIHDLPDEERLLNLGLFVKALGYELPIRRGKITGKDLQALFRKLEGRAEESLVKTAAVRSMAKAVYSTDNIGHFGLAFEYYTHFTSPIRRYADLLVHRLLAKHLAGEPIPPAEWSRYAKMAVEVSEKEIAAAEAERDSKKLKQVEFMAGMIGREFQGVISGVTEWGIYVEEKNTRAEGMVALRSLADDYYVLHEKIYAVIGERTKKRYALGDAVRFRVVGADPERKTLDYEFA